MLFMIKFTRYIVFLGSYVSMLVNFNPQSVILTALAGLAMIYIPTNSIL
jgi:hypothetical protein